MIIGGGRRQAGCSGEGVSVAHTQSSSPALSGPPPRFSVYLEALAAERARAEAVADPAAPAPTRWPERDVFEPSETRCDQCAAAERRVETAEVERVRITHDSPAGRFFDLLV